jgi:hypothetical protein
MAQPAPSSNTAVLSGQTPDDWLGPREAERTGIGLEPGQVAYDTLLAQREAEAEAARLTKLARYDDRFSCEWWPLN